MAATCQDAAPGARKTGKLRGDLRLYSSGPDAWTLFDPVSDRYFKMDSSDHSLLSRLDKIQTVDELAARLNEKSESVLAKVSFLAANGLLESGYGSDVFYSSQREAVRGQLVSKWLLNAYLFLDIPLIRPDSFLEKSAPFVLKIFNKWTLLTLALISLSGYISLLPHAESLAAAFWNSLDFQGMMAYGLALLLIKAIHEFGHAYAAKAQGVRVRRMGLAFIVFIPRFYTDITDAWRIPERSKRALIDGAGIAVELLIGGFAAIAWLHCAPGALKTVAYYIFAVSAINTVFINGNPFIKYDGYYLLMDAVGIDNLYMRGVNLTRRKFRELALGMELPPEPESLRISGWRKPFIACFAVSSMIYRFFLYTSIILIVYLEFTKILGMILFVLEAYLMLIRPLLAEAKDLARSRGAMNAKSVRLSAAILAALLLVLFTPLPWSVSLNCETKPAAGQTLSPKEDGFLASLDVPDGGQVKKGQTVLTLTNPYLDWNERANALEAKAAARELDLVRSNRKRLDEQEAQLKRLEGAKASVAETERRKTQLQVKAEQDGSMVLYDLHLKPGKWLQAGEPAGEIFDPASTEAVAYASESEVGGLKPGDKATLTAPGVLRSWKGRIVSVNVVPMKSPSFLSPLLDVVGGPLQTTSSPEDRTLRLAQPRYIVRVALDKPEEAPAGRSGTIVVRKFRSLGVDALRLVLSTLQKEISF